MPGIADIAETGRFPSRRNEVSLMRASLLSGGKLCFVRKKFVCGDADREEAALRALAGFCVPKILNRAHGILDLSYIEGPTLLAVLEKCETEGESCGSYLRELADFLAGFYRRLPGKIYGDVNFRNFIWHDGRLFGVDLEEVGDGEREADVGRAAAFFLTYSPCFTAYKKDMAAGFVRYAAKKLRVETGAIVRAMENELGDMDLRRGKSIPGEVFHAEFVKKYKL
jgi:hypothetical protein